jgi:sarcosine oxidase subunit delta
MLLIRCPYCEMERPEIEFRHAGEAHIARPAQPAETSDADWTEYLYLRTNPKGVYVERWRHNFGCARFFNAVRHTVSDKFLATYKAGEPRPDIDALVAERDPANRVQGSEDVGAPAAGGEP